MHSRVTLLIISITILLVGVLSATSINSGHHHEVITHCITGVPKGTIVDIDEIVTPISKTFLISVRPDSTKQILRYEITAEEYKKIEYQDLIDCP